MSFEKSHHIRDQQEQDEPEHKMKASIRLIRETEYAAIVDIDKGRFERLKKDLDSSNPVTRGNAEREINRMIKPDDWQDDDLSRIDEFEETT